MWGKGRECLVCVGLPVKNTENQDFHRFSFSLTIALLSEKTVKAGALPSSFPEGHKLGQAAPDQEEISAQQRSRIPPISCNSIPKGVTCPRKVQSFHNAAHKGLREYRNVFPQLPFRNMAPPPFPPTPPQTQPSWDGRNEVVFA